MKTKKGLHQAWRHGGGILGPCPPKRELCSPSEDCAPKKVTGSVPLKCSSRCETLKILASTPDFVSKNCFFADFEIKTLFLRGSTPKIVKIRAFFEMKNFFGGDVFIPEFVEIREESLCCLVHTLKFGALSCLCPHPQNLFMPPQSRYPGAGPELHQNSKVFFEVSVSELGLSELGPTLAKKEKADRAYLDGRRVARNSEWGGGCFGGLGAEASVAGGQGGSGGEAPSAREFCVFLQKSLNFRAILIKNNAFKMWLRNWQCKHD